MAQQSPRSLPPTIRYLGGARFHSNPLARVETIFNEQLLLKSRRAMGECETENTQRFADWSGGGQNLNLTDDRPAPRMLKSRSLVNEAVSVVKKAQRQGPSTGPIYTTTYNRQIQDSNGSTQHETGQVDYEILSPQQIKTTNPNNPDYFEISTLNGGNLETPVNGNPKTIVVQKYYLALNFGAQQSFTQYDMGTFIYFVRKTARQEIRLSEPDYIQTCHMQIH